MSAIYFAIPTHAGQAKIANAIALGVPLKITHMAVGDGNGQPVTPDPAQTKLVREQRRAPLNALFQDPLNPAQLVAQQIIPENEGGWWIHEVGLFDESGTLIAIANAPPTYKPQMSEGSGRTQGINVVLIVSDTSAVELKIDPSVVLATRKYVDDVMKAHKESRDHPDASEKDKGFSRFATQTEVNETTAANRVDAVVTVKTLWGWVKQAGENVMGLIKVASQDQTNAGSADDVAVTPKKIRAGFSILLQEAGGYIAFPTWLGGVILQWGTFYARNIPSYPSSPTSDLVTFPLSFTSFCGAVSGNMQSGVGTGWISHTSESKSKSGFTLRVTAQAATTTVPVMWIAIGK